MTPTRVVAACFIATVVASLALIAVYLLGGQPQVEGILLGLALGGLGVGVVIWAIRLLEAPVEIEERHPLASSEEVRAEVGSVAEVERITRRTLLVRLLLGAGATLLAALAVPVLSLGPGPGRALFRTAWREGSRVVTEDGLPVRPAELGFNTVRTVFPEDAVGAPDSATLLIRVRLEDLRLPPERVEWAPDGAIGYSKICTHAGCPVGLYRAEDHVLLCPCHQSAFDVFDVARPVSGPAARPLPQLPLDVDEDGYLVARHDFYEPVGPSFWNMTWSDPGGPALIEDADPVDPGDVD